MRAGERVLSTNNRNYRGRMGDETAEVWLASAPVAALTAILGRVPSFDEIKQAEAPIRRAKSNVADLFGHKTIS